MKCTLGSGEKYILEIALMSSSESLIQTDLSLQSAGDFGRNATSHYLSNTLLLALVTRWSGGRKETVG